MQLSPNMLQISSPVYKEHTANHSLLEYNQYRKANYDTVQESYERLSARGCTSEQRRLRANVYLHLLQLCLFIAKHIIQVTTGGREWTCIDSYPPYLEAVISLRLKNVPYHTGQTGPITRVWYSLPQSWRCTF